MSQYDEIFQQLRSLMLACAGDQLVAKDEPGELVLHSRSTDPKTGKPEWFGAVTIKKSYVAYHLFPLYKDPALGAEISAELAKRRQGKSCFNFKKVDAEAFAELGQLTSAARHLV